MKTLKGLQLGDGLDEATEMGLLINAERLNQIDGIVQEALQHGAKLETGRQRAAEFSAGHFSEPTVLTKVNDDMAIASIENAINYLNQTIDLSLIVNRDALK